MTTDGHILITGGAGFLGSHLAAYALSQGSHVTVMDDLSTGELRNIEKIRHHPHFRFLYTDVREEQHWTGPLDVIFNLASPASPPVYSADKIGCLTTNALGAHTVAQLAHVTGARLVQASTSEVYGDPLEHPQRETYLGNVNPVGPRSCYDEGKRYAEAYLTAHREEYGTDTGIVRIFNTYGPHMSPYDGRVISNLIHQALSGESLTVYGNGTQTRSFCYVDDLIRALWAMGESHHPGPINIGNPDEYTVGEIALEILHATGSSSGIEYRPLPPEDPTRRKPDITRAREVLNWFPETPLHVGLARTIEWHREVISRSQASKG